MDKFKSLGNSKAFFINVLVKYKYLTSGDHTTNRVSKLCFNNSSDCLNYKYDDYGNITEVRHLNELVARYKYDDLNRLVREDNKELDKTCTYTYDAGGNITERREYVYTLVDNLELEDNIPYIYTYALTGWADQLLCYNGKNFVYDVLGNPTIYKDSVLSWSHGRRLDKFNDVEYEYNANGIRISKTVDDVETRYILNGSKVLQLTQGEHTMTFRYGVNGVAGFNLDGSEYTYKKNLQNDVIAILNSENKQIAEYTYDAWGVFKCKILSNIVTYIANGTLQEYTISELDELAIQLNPFTYRSYIYDKETNLYYLNSRYYDPETGRFVNADDISILSYTKDEINGANLYIYCLNNPVNDVDENGCWSWKAFWKIIAAVAIVVAVTVAVVATAGALATAAVGAGAFASTIAASTAVGSLSTGAFTIISQGISNGFENLNLGDIAIDTFIGGIHGTITAAIPVSTGLFTKVIGGIGKVFLSGIDSLLHGINHKDDSQTIGLDMLKSMTVSTGIQVLFIGGGEFFKNVKWSNSNTSGKFTDFIKSIIDNPLIKTFFIRFGIAITGHNR